MSDSAPKRTALHEAHVSLGARMVPFAGYDMPVQYPAGIIAEHNWTRQNAGIFDSFAEWLTDCSGPKPEGTCSIKGVTASALISGIAKPPLTRPKFHSHRPVPASDTWTCQLPPSRAWRAFAIMAPNAMK